jgi:murein DD-endopeptidase MepM/ murein hydrolase activator NlpD
VRTILLFAALSLAACVAPPPRAPSAPAGPPRTPAPQAAAPWKPVPAVADGIRVEGGRLHIVKRGETGISIARAYGVAWSRIVAANRLGRDPVLAVGQSLFIPLAARAPVPPPRRGAPPPRPLTPEQQAAAFHIDIDDLVTGSAEAVEVPATGRPTAPAPPRGSAAPAAVRSGPVPALAWPVDGRVILSRFGAKPGGRFNDGINIRAVRGQTVRAAADGEVIYVGDAIGSFGLLMLLRHPGGIVTAYAHLDEAIARRGDRVARGQPIGRAGQSGAVSEPQLQFQVRQGRKPVDPLPYLQ